VEALSILDVEAEVVVVLTHGGAFRSIGELSSGDECDGSALTQRTHFCRCISQMSVVVMRRKVAMKEVDKKTTVTAMKA
jgi:hypothetical protein